MFDENVQRGRLPGLGQPMESLTRNRLNDNEGALLPHNVPSNVTPYELNLQQQTPGEQPVGYRQRGSGHQTGRGQSPGALSMSGLAGALPNYQFPSTGHANTANGASNFQTQQMSGQPSLNSPNYSSQLLQYASTYQQGYQAQQSSQSNSGGPNSFHPSYPGGVFFPAQQQQYLYYPAHYTQPVQMQHGPYPSSFGPGSSEQQGLDISNLGGRMSHSGYLPGIPSSSTHIAGVTYLRPGSMPASQRESSNSSVGSIPSTPRGPPRKPKQSGHALWVGNLPSGTAISELKDHFSRDATKDIESVFLISKSNCAFVNYRTEAACAAAMARFHDSRFQGARLVCRLRRNTVAAPSVSGVPTGPAASLPAVKIIQSTLGAAQITREVSHELGEASDGLHRTGESVTKVTDKYFVMKSLTVEDMELSVRNCIWATQAHNEEALNKAFETAENVYLVFSANKSGEYFGFARMASPINDETAAGLDWAPRGETVINDPDIPRSIPTAPTEFAPRGRIIDDSARGTIFWEADPEEEDLAPIIDREGDDPVELQRAEETAEDAEDSAIAGEAHAFGKPFKIEWISTNRLPFYRTRGLRNPWNSNREVKIARDGTEIETSVGRRLIQMFQKLIVSERLQQTAGLSPGEVYQQ